MWAPFLTITFPNRIRAAGICISLAGHIVALRGGHIAHRSTRSTGCTDHHILAWKRRRRVAGREGFFPVFPATRPRFQGEPSPSTPPNSQKATQKNIPNRVKLRQKRFTALHLRSFASNWEVFGFQEEFLDLYTIFYDPQVVPSLSEIAQVHLLCATFHGFSLQILVHEMNQQAKLASEKKNPSSCL